MKCINNFAHREKKNESVIVTFMLMVMDQKHLTQS